MRYHRAHRTAARRSILLAAAAVVLVTAGCSTYPPMFPDSTRHKLLDIPFVKQRRQYCGPAALTSMLKYYGVERTQEEIGREIFRPVIKGVLKEDLVWYARKEGFDVKSGRSNLDEVKSYIDADTPVIAFTLLGPRFFFRGHFVLVVGYDDPKDKLICHTGYHSYEGIWYRRFLGKWRSNWIMVISPKDRTKAKAKPKDAPGDAPGNAPEREPEIGRTRPPEERGRR